MANTENTVMPVLEGYLANENFVDETLSRAGAAADAKEVGDRLQKMDTAFDQRMTDMDEAFDQRMTNMDEAFDRQMDALESNFDNRLGLMNEDIEKIENVVDEKAEAYLGQISESTANSLAQFEETSSEKLEQMEEKGKEVLKTLPDDYLELEERVGQLSEEISDETKNRQNAVAQETAARNAAIAQERNRAVARENEIEELFSMPTQEAVNKWLDEHPEASTTVQDKSLTIDKMVVGTLGYVTPEMFGAKGDGVTDDTTAINNALQCAGIVVLGNDKTYMVDATVSLKVKSNTSIIIPKTTTIKAFETTASASRVFSVKDCNNVIITGGIIDGNFNRNTGVMSEFGHGISIIDSENVHISHTEILNCNGDCIYIGAVSTGSDRVYIEKCKLHDSIRQGVSVVGCNNSLIRDTEIYSISGKLPESGIDFEPNSDSTQTNGVGIVDHCHIHDCAGESITSARTTKHIIIKDCTTDTIRLNNNGDITIQETSIIGEKLIFAGGNITLDKLNIPHIEIGIRQPKLQGNLIIKDCKFLSLYNDGSSGESGYNNIIIDNCVIDNVDYNPTYSPLGNSVTYAYKMIVRNTEIVCGGNKPSVGAIKTSCEFLGCKLSSKGAATYDAVKQFLDVRSVAKVKITGNTFIIDNNFFDNTRPILLFVGVPNVEIVGNMFTGGNTVNTKLIANTPGDANELFVVCDNLYNKDYTYSGMVTDGNNRYYVDNNRNVMATQE